MAETKEQPTPTDAGRCSEGSCYVSVFKRTYRKSKAEERYARLWAEVILPKLLEEKKIGEK